MFFKIFQLGSKQCHISTCWKPVVLVLLFILWVATLTPGHNWGGDFSQYILHAINLVEGRAYSDIGYIYNTFSFVAPPAYPPVFPLVLAPFYALFGFNLFVFKMLLAAFFIIALYVATIMTTKKLTNLYQFVFILILALNPYLWLQKDQVLSEFLFMLIVFVTLVILNQRYVKTETGYCDTKSKNWWFAALIGLFLYLSYATREIGIVFIPAILCFELFYFRKISLATGVALLTFVALIGIQSYAIKTPPSNPERAERVVKLAEEQGEQSTAMSHADLININLGHITNQAERYVRSMRNLWPDSDVQLVYLSSTIALVIFLLFAFGGYLRSVYFGPTLLDIFVAGYMAVLFLFAGFDGLRYMIPLVPVFFLYAFRLHEELLKTTYKKIMLVIAVVFLGATTVNYASSNFYVSGYNLGILNPYAKEFFSYVKESTPSDSIFIFAKPRVMALITGRQASTRPKTHRKNDILVKYMVAIRATYLVHSAVEVNGMQSSVNELVLPNDKFELTFNNGYFHVYKLLLK